MDYFKFSDLSRTKMNKSRFIDKVVVFVLSLFIPKANPDFDEKIRHVVLWYIEYDTNINCAIREIGVDSDNRIITKAPYHNNLGYWTDSDMTIGDYDSQFSLIKIKKSDFESVWNCEIGS